MDGRTRVLPNDSEWVELLWFLGEAAILLEEREAAQAVPSPRAVRRPVGGRRLRRRLLRPGLRPAGPARDTWVTGHGQPGRAAFVRTGTVWQVDFRGRAATLVDSKGMRDLAALLARPGREVHVLDLVEATGGPPGPPPRHRSGAGRDGPGGVPARLARAGRRDRPAARDHDLGRPHGSRAERSSSIAELAAALGLGGRARTAATRSNGPARRWPCGSPPPCGRSRPCTRARPAPAQQRHRPDGSAATGLNRRSTGNDRR